MIKRAVLGVVAIVAMAVPATAWGGGFTTVGLHELPTDVQAGVPWNAEFTVLGHGRTPAPGMSPTVTISRPDGTGTKTFPATDTGRPGDYRAKVVFPTDGTWRMVVTEWEGSPGHTFGTVKVGERATAGAATSSGDGPWGALLAAIAAGVFAGGLAALFSHRRRPTTA